MHVCIFSFCHLTFLTAEKIDCPVTFLLIACLHLAILNAYIFPYFLLTFCYFWFYSAFLAYSMLTFGYCTAYRWLFGPPIWSPRLREYKKAYFLSNPLLDDDVELIKTKQGRQQQQQKIVFLIMCICCGKPCGLW